MSFASKPKKFIPKGTVRELKVVKTVNRRGTDTIKTEEIKTPRRGSQKESTSQLGGPSSSPKKRAKVEVFDEDPIPWHLEDDDVYNKRQTLVFIFPW